MHLQETDIELLATQRNENEKKELQFSINPICLASNVS